MIRILSNEYRKSDYTFLWGLLDSSIRSVQSKCVEDKNLCLYCEHRRACLDVTEAVEFLNKEVSK